ncbi:DUF397 domain-containing protein [Streptomyces sp. NPDC057257]|uniref:DUF397 domain-containing protein n=1 Tax=Streptomyces sp. NPDC057257 TaxID=3346071 RepID=UPI00363BA2DE
MSAALEWFKSSYSSDDGPACVEVAISPADRTPTVHVRDSKDAHRAQLAFAGASWSEFVDFAAHSV